jgi:ABC-type amino acid transport substrate-binding protein
MKLRIFFLLVALVFGWWLISKCRTPVESKPYLVARDPTWAPLNLYNKSTDLLIFSDQLLNAIASKEDIAINTISIGTDRLITGLDNHEFDAILTSVIPAPNYLYRYAISETYYRMGPVLVVPSSSNVNSISQMENRSVGIMRDSSLVFDFEKIPNLDLVSFDNPVLAIEALTTGKIDGVIMDILPAYSYTNKFYAGQIKIATSPLNQKGLKLIARQDQRGEILVEKFNKGLAEVKADGIYNKLIENWGLVNQ